MSSKLDVDEIVALARDKHINADELDILVSRARELNAAREKDLARLKKVLTDLEARLAESGN